MLNFIENLKYIIKTIFNYHFFIKFVKTGFLSAFSDILWLVITLEDLLLRSLFYLFCKILSLKCKACHFYKVFKPE